MKWCRTLFWSWSVRTRRHFVHSRNTSDRVHFKGSKSGLQFLPPLWLFHTTNYPGQLGTNFTSIGSRSHTNLLKTVPMNIIVIFVRKKWSYSTSSITSRNVTTPRIWSSWDSFVALKITHTISELLMRNDLEPILFIFTYTVKSARKCLFFATCPITQERCHMIGYNLFSCLLSCKIIN